jgi:hypothetical protein
MHRYYIGWHEQALEMHGCCRLQWNVLFDFEVLYLSLIVNEAWDFGH